LFEGASWWKGAFENAGYIDAYQVKMLPPGIDPLDIRYNVVNWTNRATRGWSYGQVVEDPRTGEIIKGQVLLGSLRVRQDMLIFEGLVGADKVGRGGPNDPSRRHSRGFASFPRTKSATHWALRTISREALKAAIR
jgi:hypothetical protein